MSAVSYAELDQLSGELLPERAVLGIVSTPFNNYNPSNGNGTVVIDNSSSHGATVVSACQATNSSGTPGLLGSLGLGSNNPTSSLTCVPAAAAG